MYEEPTPDRGPAPPPPPGLWRLWTRSRIVALVVLLAAGNFLLQIVAYVLGLGLFVPVLVGAVGGVLAPLAWLARHESVDGRGDFGFDRLDPVEIVGAAALAAAALAPSSLLAELSLRLHPADPQWAQSFHEALPDTPLDIVVAVVAVVVVAPLAEELVFRGLSHRLLRGIWGGPAASVLSALIFAIVHAEPWFLLGLFGVGLMLAAVWEATRSVAACWCAHAVHNAISLGLMLTSEQVVPEPSPIEPTDWGWTAVSLLAFAGIAAWLMRRRAERAI